MRRLLILLTCTALAGCETAPTAVEGTSYQSGWRGTLSLGLGGDLPVTRALRFQPSVRVLRLGTGDAGSRDEWWLLRLGVGVAWRR